MHQAKRARKQESKKARELETKAGTHPWHQALLLERGGFLALILVVVPVSNLRITRNTGSIYLTPYKT